MSTPTKESAPLWLGQPVTGTVRAGQQLELRVRGSHAEVYLLDCDDGIAMPFMGASVYDIGARTIEWIRSIAALDPKLVAAVKVCEAAAALPMRGSTIVDTSELHAAIDAWEALP